MSIEARPSCPVLDEHLRIMGRKKWYGTLGEMRKDLDAYLVTYNEERPHQGRNMNRRVPLKAFKEGLKLVPKAIEKESLKQAA